MAGQDYRLIIPANATLPMQVVGDFVYCKQADRPVYVQVDGKTIEMEAGDKHKPAKKFNGIEIENKTDNPVQVVFVIGVGDYNRQIIQGEVSVTPGIRNSAGDFLEDTREEFSYLLNGYNVDPVDIVGGELLDTIVIPFGVVVAAYIPELNAIVSRGTSSANWYLTDVESMAYVRPITSEMGNIISGVGGYQISTQLIVADTKRGGIWVGLKTASTGKISLRRHSPQWEPVGPAFGTEIGNNAGVGGLVYVPDTDELWLMQTNATQTGTIVNIYDAAAGELIAQIDEVPVWCYGAYYKEGAVIFSKDDGTQIKAYDVLSRSEINLRVGDVAARNGSAYLKDKGIVISSEAGYYLSVYSAREYTKRAYLSAVKSSCGGFGIVKPRRLYSGAEVYIQDRNGSKLIAGAVIRAVLDSVIGFAPENYLDYVYKFEGESEHGAPVIRSSGAKSFDALSINDNFTVKINKPIKLTLAKELFEV